MISPMAARLPPTCRSAQDDLSDTYRNVIGAIFTACNGLCGVGLLNDSDCKSEIQIQLLEDVGGSTTRGCDNYCDSGSDVENEVTPIKTRLLRKG